MKENNEPRIYLITDLQLEELANKIAGKVMAGLSVEPTKKNTSEGENLLSVNEVCKMFHVSKPTLWRWEKNGRLMPVRVSDKVLRYKLSDIEKVLSNDRSL